MTSEVSFSAIQDSEERYLRPKALRENIDVSTWSETARAWVPEKTAGYALAKVINSDSDKLVDVELEDGMVRGHRIYPISCHLLCRE